MAGEEGRSAQHGAADRTAVGVAAGGLVHENLQVLVHRPDSKGQ